MLAAQPGGVIEATVVNSVTGAGVPGAEVRVWTADANRAVGQTDALGKVRFEGLNVGEYNWSAAHPEYLPPEQPPVLLREMLHVEADGDPVQARMELVPPASLRGRVLDAEGNPAAGIRVAVAPGTQEETAADGTFAIGGLRAGTYSLVAMPEPSEPVTSDGGRRTVTVPTFYPFVTEAAQAGKIEVAAGAHLTGFEIRLQTAPVYRVRGVVLDPEGRPAAGAMVLHEEGTGPYASFGPDSFTVGDRSINVLAVAREPVRADEQGVFELPAVQPGLWRLQARLDGEYDVVAHRDRSISGGAEVLVGARDVEDVEIRLVRPFTWKGRVEWGEVPQELRNRLGLMLVPLNSDRAGFVAAKPDGTAEVAELAAGRYRFQAMRMGGQAYVASIRMGNIDLLAGPFEVFPFSQPFQVIVKTDAGGVRGTVERGEGAEVVLLPRGFEAGDVAVHTKAGAGGAFEIGGLRPGDYVAFALPAVDPEINDIARFRNLLPRAAAVSVEAGSTAFLQLRVLAGR